SGADHLFFLAGFVPEGQTCAMSQPPPKPCKRYRKMTASPKFFAHLPDCEECKAAIAYLNRESGIDQFVHDHRN
ncbi:MAG TPA: hypothetical protein VN946_12725, partial [Terriglobales bacterium]|nr:hypothetical protein [Terriglobales bacterium]